MSNCRENTLGIFNTQNRDKKRRNALKCSVQVDSLGSECLNNLENSRNLYKYKGFLKIPPLEFVDYVLTITKYSTDSIKMKALFQSKVECKKLEFSDTKCFKMQQEHIMLPKSSSEQ